MLINKRYQKVYHLTQKGMNELSQAKSISIKRSQFKSNSKEHDLHLINIMESLKRSRHIVKHYTENELQCVEKFSESDLTKEFVDMNSDAFVQISYGNKLFSSAIEYEHSENADSKYEQLVLNYYLSSTINIVLFFTSHDWIRELIFRLEEKDYTNSIPKFYFLKTQNDYGMIENLTFQNRKGKTLDLN
jgi:hypothetical protein